MSAQQSNESNHSTSSQNDQLTADHELNDCKLNHLSIRGGANGHPVLRPSASCSVLPQEQTEFLAPTTFRPPSFSNSFINVGMTTATAPTSLRSLKLLASNTSIDLSQNNNLSFGADSSSASSISILSQYDSSMTGATMFSQNPATTPSTSETQFSTETANIFSSNASSLASTPKQKDEPTTLNATTLKCAVCGDTASVARHYGVIACLGCKGFFRRALKKADQYECINNDRCKIDQYERNSCRSCRFKKCLESGMEPGAVRPDRDFTGKQQALRLASNAKRPKPSPNQDKLQTTSKEAKQKPKIVDKEEIWKKLPVEMRTMIMSLLNIEVKICRGDTVKDAKDVYPLHIQTIHELIEDPLKLRGKRTEMRYEPYRMAKNEELHVIVYRRLIAAIDWVECLSEMMDGIPIEDKIILVKSSFGPLMLFKNAARTAGVTNDENILCVCNFSYVPRNMANAYTDTYHLDNGLVGRILDELVAPLRKLQVSEAELVCLSAIIVLNPMARDLSVKAADKVMELRNRIQDALYQYLKEGYADYMPTTRFGNLLLYLPILSALANTVRENLRFAQTFSSLGSIPLLTSLFGCFPVEPFLDSDNRQPGTVLRKSVETQTDDPRTQVKKKKITKRRLPQSFTSPVENEQTSAREFNLLQPPCSYTLTEMFDDRMNDNTRLTHNPRLPPFIQPYQPSTSVPQQQYQQKIPNQQNYPYVNANQNGFQFDASQNSNVISAQFQPQQSAQLNSIPNINLQHLPQNQHHTISGYPSSSNYQQHRLPHQYSYPS